MVVTSSSKVTATDVAAAQELEVLEDVLVLEEDDELLVGDVLPVVVALLMGV